MLTFISILLRFLRELGIALWLGGLIVIGALVAPTAFLLVRHLPALQSSPQLQTTIAGGVVGGSLRLFNIVCFVCGALILLSDVGLFIFFRRLQAPRAWTLVSLILTALLLASAAYLGGVLFPALDLAQHRHQMASFDRLHHLYEQLSELQMPVLLVLIVAGAARDSISRKVVAVSHAPTGGLA